MSRYFKEEEMNIFFAGWTVRLPGSDDQGHRGGGWQEQPPLQRGWQHAHLQTKVSHLHREALVNIGQVFIILVFRRFYFLDREQSKGDPDTTYLTVTHCPHLT